MTDRIAGPACPECHGPTVLQAEHFAACRDYRLVAKCLACKTDVVLGPASAEERAVLGGQAS